MPSHVEKLIKASASASLPHRKLISAGFATTYPNQPLDARFKEISKKKIISGIGSQNKYVKSALETLAQNTIFTNVYENLSSKRSQKASQVDSQMDSQVDSQMTTPTKEKGKERKKVFPRPPF